MTATHCTNGLGNSTHNSTIKKIHLEILDSSYIKTQEPIYSFSGVSVSLKGVITHAAELLKKIILGEKLGYKLISKGCHTDNYSTLGMTAIYVTKTGIYGCCC